jgi:hypothetical protein
MLLGQIKNLEITLPQAGKNTNNFTFSHKRTEQRGDSKEKNTLLGF